MRTDDDLARAALSRRGACLAIALAGGAAVLTGCGGSGSQRGSEGSAGGSSSRGPMLPPTGSGGWSSSRSSGGAAGGSRTPGQEALDRFRRERGGAPAGVIARREWTRSGPVVSRARPMSGVTRITVHHDGTDAFRVTSKMSAMERIERIRRAHVGRGWADIGYHFVIDPAGRVYEGRSTTLQGAHVKYNNERNLGVLVLGNYNRQSVTGDTRAALSSFVGAQMRRYGVPIGRVYTHQEIRPTECPGRTLQAQMLDLRSGRGALRFA